MVLPEMSGLGEVHHSRGQLHALPNKNDFQEVIRRGLAAHNPDAPSTLDTQCPHPLPSWCVFNLAQQEGSLFPPIPGVVRVFVFSFCDGRGD
jgi:hypothetical protein